jgi:FkbM family methyltransferase
MNARAGVTKLLMSGPAVAAVEPLTRRRIRHLGVTVATDPALVNRWTRAEIFWGLYERTECDYVRRHLVGTECAIEVGAGLGVASAHIAAGARPEASVTSVEANPAFVPLIERNLSAHAGAGVQTRVLNVGIAPDAAGAVLHVEANPFASHVGGSARSDSRQVQVPTRSLDAIVDELPRRTFDLVSDIEGAEALFILGESSALERCRRLIIELHHGELDGVSFTPDDLLEALVERWSFSMLERKGPVAALARA